MPKILIVDDEEDIIELIKRYALANNYEVSSASDGINAVEICKENDFDCIIMDVMMKDMDGFTAVKKIKELKDIPVLMLSARGTEYDKMYGFEVGVDDYVTKPFSPNELMARIKVIINRHSNFKKDGFIIDESLKIDTLGHEVFADNQKLELTNKEYELLLYLVRNKGIVLTREQIMNKVWNYDSFEGDRTVDFILFSVIIFLLLGLLQILFMQTFYNKMLIDNTKKVATKIVDLSNNKDIYNTLYETIDSLARENNILVYITDENSKIIYSADSYKSSYNNEIHNKNNDNPYFQNEELNYMEANYRNLPADYEDFIQKLKTDGHNVEIKNDKLYIYGSYININNNSYILYVSSTLGAVGSTTSIIKTQLIIVSILSLIIGFILSYLISRKVEEPILEIKKEAKNIGTKDYHKINNDFCLEFNELSNTLNEKSEELKDSYNYQKELLSNISHDLRTPLTMIKGYVEMIRDIPDVSKNTREKDINTILRETERLNNLVNEILEYGELESNHVSYKFESINMSNLVNKVVNQFEPLFKNDGGIIESEIENKLFIEGNKNQIERVIYNLIDNAIRHTKDNKKIKVLLFKKDNMVRLEVTDYGKGIPKDELKFIWDRYYTSRQRNGKGVSGLGLSIVKQIIKIHNGKYGVESELNKGSTFWIEVKIK